MFFNLIPKRLGLIPKGWQPYSNSQLYFLRNTAPLIARCFSASNQHSFTVSYLVDSCGLSLEAAISASKKLNFENPKNPDSVLTLLKNSGFTDAHITKIVTKLPSLLSIRPEKNLLPKLQFFCSIGLSGAQLATFLSSRPYILKHSLEKNLLPMYNFLKSIDIRDEDVIKILWRSSWTARGRMTYLEETIAANIAVLRTIGVPVSNISFLVVCYNAINQRSDKFHENVKKVVEMGFDPTKFTFVNALRAFCQSTESSRQQRMDIYRKWGWSEDEILLAFRIHPGCMQLSEKHVMEVLDFLVNKMGWAAGAICKDPVALCLNFKKRVAPRCSLVKVLQSKGLVKKDLRLGAFLRLTEKDFFHKFVIRYQDDMPQLLELYQGKVAFPELGFGLE